MLLHPHSLTGLCYTLPMFLSRSSQFASTGLLVSQGAWLWRKPLTLR
jgi:hypothetical protein